MAKQRQVAYLGPSGHSTDVIQHGGGLCQWTPLYLQKLVTLQTGTNGQALRYTFSTVRYSHH